MQPQKQKAQTNVQARYPRMMILWFGQLMSIVALFLFSSFLGPEAGDQPETSLNKVLIVALTGLATFLVIASFVVKRKLLERSVEKQDIELVQRAFVMAVAMCEMSAMLGVIERFVINDRYYYLLFLMAAAGTAFHFPRTEHLAAATYKASTSGSIS